MSGKIGWYGGIGGGVGLAVGWCLGGLPGALIGMQAAAALGIKVGALEFGAKEGAVVVHKATDALLKTVNVAQKYLIAGGGAALGYGWGKHVLENRCTLAPGDWMCQALDASGLVLVIYCSGSFCYLLKIAASEVAEAEKEPAKEPAKGKKASAASVKTATIEEAEDLPSTLTSAVLSAAKKSSYKGRKSLERFF